MGTCMASRIDLSTVLTLLVSVFWIAAGTITITACNGATDSTEVETSDASSSQDEGEADAGLDASSCKATFPVSQPLSAPCCTEWNVDACGAGLFCAALDGRTQATCYPERSRRHGSTCLADDNCVSDHCDAQTKICNLRPGATCDPGDPCARDGNGVPHDCLEARCTPVPCDPMAQTGCAESEACDLVEATAGCRKVGTAKLGEPCAEYLGLGCRRGLTCVDGACRKICRNDADCTGGGGCLLGGSRPFAFCSM